MFGFIQRLSGSGRSCYLSTSCCRSLSNSAACSRILSVCSLIFSACSSTFVSAVVRRLCSSMDVVIGVP